MIYCVNRLRRTSLSPPSAGPIRRSRLLSVNPRLLRSGGGPLLYFFVKLKGAIFWGPVPQSLESIESGSPTAMHGLASSARSVSTAVGPP
jgi:hypothetical protein